MLLISALVLLQGPAPSATNQVYRDPSRSVAERTRDLLSRMTLEEKFWQLFMIPGDLDDTTQNWSNGVFGLQVRGSESARAHADRLNAMQRFFVERTRLGIPIIPFEEAVHGVLMPGATMFPQAIGLAATWDTALVGRVGEAIAKETRSRGIRQVLSPVVNLASDVRWGRTEETFGEDPLLSSVMGMVMTRALERQGIIATPKHFVANVGDGGRDSYPIELSPRTLQERFYPPFEASLRQANAGSIMTAYNSVDGSPATQNRRLLREILKGEWGFRGFVISDAAATGGAVVLHRTEPSTAQAAAHALEAGLDVIFQSSFAQHRPYLDAFRRGLIADSVIDEAVTRVLRAKFERGLFEQPYTDPDSAAFWNGHADHRALAREASRASIVLLRNEAGALPLQSSARVALIGVDAIEARLGGYSGPGNNPVSILSAFRERLGSRVRFVAGPGRSSLEHSVIPAEYLTSPQNGVATPGLRGEYFDNPRLEGSPRLTRIDGRMDFTWTFNPPAQGLSRDWYSVRWTGGLRVPAGGIRRIGVEGNDGYRLYLDDRLIIDNWKKESYRARLASVTLLPGSLHTIRLEYFETVGNVHLKLVWDAGPRRDPALAIDSAVAIARQNDVAVIVAGIEEGEFRDRAFLNLPGHQETLIQRVAATGTPVIVVLVGGSAITMSRWIDAVRGVVQIWYPGEQGGRAVTEVLFGDTNPAGRLPITFPMSEGQLPLVYDHKPTGRGDDYLDLTGKPLFPFGFGLSYSTFAYSGLTIEPSVIGPAGTAVVRCKVKNTGLRSGDEVVQLYLRDPVASVARPVIQLAGFRRIHLAQGEEREVEFTLGPDQLRMLNQDMRWVVEPGQFHVLVGASSVDIRLKGELTVQ